MSATASAALPRGPHNLSRAEVERSQRDRLLWAMTEAVAEKGYVETSVADVLSRAGVSRATFYQLFADKADCFRAAYQVNAELVARMMETELEALGRSKEADPLARLDRVLSVYLDALVTAPALARVFLIEVYAAGPDAMHQRQESLNRFVDIIAATHKGESGLIGTKRHQRFAVEALAGAVSSMVTNIVGTGEIERLPRLRKPLMQLAGQLSGRS